MSDRRVDHLLVRELDGELTELEQTEFARAIRSNVAARRERSGWDRVRSGFAETTAPTTLNTAKMAAVIADELPRRRSSSRFVVGAAAAALVFAFVASPKTKPVVSTPSAPVAAKMGRAPVVVFVDDAVLGDEREPVPVEIHF